MPTTWPEDLFEFAFVPETDAQLKLLAEEAESEDWAHHYTSSEHPFPVLYNYIRYTYRRVAECQAHSFVHGTLPHCLRSDGFPRLVMN